MAKKKTLTLTAGVGILGVCALCVCVFSILSPSSSKQEVKSVQTQIIQSSTSTQVAVRTCDEKETSRKCTDCNIAKVEFIAKDCSVGSKSVEDTGCNALCPQPVVVPAPNPAPPPEPAYEPPPATTCCKVCTTGYACGDSCISRSKQCHKSPGCACDG